mmetsp:Transcript_17875/g.29804  ORF Transcript_17875/g.29804 Transcript_17875/m.29804 type:complete len:216 (-) Transcript_17875:136-783(-)
MADLAAERATLAAERRALAAARESFAAERNSFAAERVGLSQRGKKETMDDSLVTLTPGVVKTITRQGSGPLPKTGQLAEISYLICLSNSTTVDLTGQKFTPTEEEPSLVQAFNLGDKRVPAFVNMAVASMRAGETAEVKSIGYYAFEKGMNDVPRDVNVNLEIYLIRFGDDKRTPIRNSTLLLFFAGFLLLLFLICGGSLPSTGLIHGLDQKAYL